MRRSIQDAFGLDSTDTIVGNASSASLFELQRGSLVERDTRIPLPASAFEAAQIDAITGVTTQRMLAVRVLASRRSPLLFWSCRIGVTPTVSAAGCPGGSRGTN